MLNTSISRRFKKLTARTSVTKCVSKQTYATRHLKEPSWSISEIIPKKGDNTMRSEGISEQQLLKISNLAYLSPSEEKVPKLCNDINDILFCIEQIQNVDTSNVPPLLSVLSDYNLKVREDAPRPTSESFVDVTPKKDQDARDCNFDEEPVILGTATEKDSVFFVVPKQKEPWEEEEE